MKYHQRHQHNQPQYNSFLYIIIGCLMALVLTIGAWVVYKEISSQNERKAAQRSEHLKGMSADQLRRDGSDDAIVEGKKRTNEVVDNLWKQYR